MGTEERTIAFALFNIVLWTVVLVVGAFNGATWLGQFMATTAVIAAIASLIWVAAEDRDRHRKPHVHSGETWDGYTEVCACGVSASERRDARTGLPLTYFKDWQ